MVNVCAIETTLKILDELGERLCSIEVDVSWDFSMKEQMSINFSYVNKNENIIIKNIFYGK